MLCIAIKLVSVKNWILKRNFNSNRNGKISNKLTHKFSSENFYTAIIFNQ